MDEVFICGPEEMLFSTRQQLLDIGVPAERIHIELFSSPDQPQFQHEKWIKDHSRDAGTMSKVSVKLDGVTFEMDLAYNSDSILDAALKHGADLPYACKGGVCSTCRAKVVEGEVEMEVNYALEKDELAKGFVLTCQSHPKTDRVVIDFDISFNANITAFFPLIIPFLKAKGLAPAATFFKPSVAIAWQSKTAVVVPSPAMSFVFEATSFIISAPMFSILSSSSNYS